MCMEMICVICWEKYKYNMEIHPEEEEWMCCPPLCDHEKITQDEYINMRKI